MSTRSSRTDSAGATKIGNQGQSVQKAPETAQIRGAADETSDETKGSTSRQFQARLDKLIRWFRANGISERNVVASGITVDGDGVIHWQQVVIDDNGNHSFDQRGDLVTEARSAQQTVTFEEANPNAAGVS